MTLQRLIFSAFLLFQGAFSFAAEEKKGPPAEIKAPAASSGAVEPAGQFVNLDVSSPALVWNRDTKQYDPTRLFLPVGLYEIPTDKQNLRKAIGAGSSGVVFHANKISSKGKAPRALKRIRLWIQELSTDRNAEFRDIQRYLRELRVARFLKYNQHPNLVGADDIWFKHANGRDYLYFTMEWMERNLREVLHMPHHKTGWTEKHAKAVMVQLLHGLRFLHKAGIAHKDIKPPNLLINGANSALKIADFGLAAGNVDCKKCDGTNVVTIWYRAPELCLDLDYDERVDIWSAGIVLAEILRGGQALFEGSTNECMLHMMERMAGYPFNSLRDHGLPAEDHLDVRIQILSQQPYLNENTNHLAIDLLARMLALNPDHRITIEQALAHEYFRDIQIVTPEYGGEPLDFSDIEAVPLGDIDTLLKMIYAETNLRARPESQAPAPVEMQTNPDPAPVKMQPKRKRSDDEQKAEQKPKRLKSEAFQAALKEAEKAGKVMDLTEDTP